MEGSRVSRVVVSSTLVGLLFLSFGCAALGPLPPAKSLQQGDLSRLAGAWEWASWKHTPARLGPGRMTVRLREGKMAFETARATGVLTFHESDGWRVLNGTGRDKVNGDTFEVRLTQWGSGQAVPASRADAGRMLVLVVVD